MEIKLEEWTICCYDDGGNMDLWHDYCNTDVEVPNGSTIVEVLALMRGHWCHRRVNYAS